MVFFELSIPYDGKDTGCGKTLRVKLATKAMELGYVGIAYNRSIKGIMSEKDRCTIPLLTVESLVKFAPPLSSSVGLHRDLLGIRRDTPFRQYTRLTVSVENSAQSLALNSDNPILKSYDIVAVRPLNQSAFEQACEKAKVDMISIDFSGNLPFRLKHPMVKAAVQRGIYFEIRYSDLLVDAHKRRQVISNAKLLVDWTRGKNLIISSGAPSVTELRGPNDVMNLMSLLGLSAERARASISKNCRNMITNALRRKRFYKDTVRVEFASTDEKFDLDQPLPGDWLRWDPLSTGDGDLALDDLAKAFGATNNAAPKSSKAIDFTSILDDLPSRGFQVNDIIVETVSAAHPPAEKVIDEPVESNRASELPLTVSTASGSNLLENASDQTSEDEKKDEHMTIVAEKESVVSESCSSSHDQNRTLQCRAEAFQTLITDMDLDATTHGNTHSSTTLQDIQLLNGDSGSPQDHAKIASTGSVPVDGVVMGTNVGFDEKHVSGSRDNTLVGNDKMIVDDSADSNHERTETVAMEDQKYGIENGNSLYNMFSVITALVSEPLKYPCQDVVASDQSPRVSSHNEAELIEEPLGRNHVALDEKTTERKTNEEAVDRNDHQILVQSIQGTNVSNSGKPRGKKRMVHLSQLRPFKPFLHPSRFKRSIKRSKHRRDKALA